MLAALPASAGDGLTEIVGITGNQAPGGGNFQTFGAPVLNNRGEVAVTSTIFGGDERLVFGGVGALEVIARLGDIPVDQAAPIDGFGRFGGAVSLSDAGDIAFLGSVNQASGTTDAVLVSRNPLFGGRELEELGRVNRDGDNNPFLELDSPNINSRGDATFRAEDQVFGPRVIFAERGRDPVGFFRAGASPVGDNNGDFDDFARPAINNASELIVAAQLRDTENGGFDDAIIERLARNAGGFINQRTVIREPASVSGVQNVSLDQRRSPVLNQRGQIAFDGFADFRNAVMRIDINADDSSPTGDNLRVIAQFDDFVPGGDGRFGQPLARDINDSGEVAFTSSLFGNSGGFDENFGVFVGNGFNNVEIFREGDAAPGGGEFDGNVFGVHMAEGGQVAFSTFLRNTGESFDLGNGISIEGLGIFIGDGQETITVARLGEELLGSPITSLEFVSDKDLGGRTLLNDRGQVAFGAELADGSDGVFLFTPELRFRSGNNGSWDNANNWTIGILPSEVHDVVLDSDASVTITGPSDDTTVRSLTIGGGAGQVELRLDDGSTITPLSGDLEVNQRGRLSGDGVVNARLINRSVVEPENIFVEGEIVNLGTIEMSGFSQAPQPSRLASTETIDNRGVITGGGLIDAAIFNQTGAEIRIGDGQRLVLGREGSSNEGRIEVFGGELELNGFVVNQAGGSILARDATLRLDEGLLNRGDLAISFGENTDLFGALVNEATGRAFVTGDAEAAFFDEVRNDGDIRVDPGSAAVFFGDVSGAGSISGGGDIFFQAGVSPGNSPAEVTFNADVTFEASSLLEIELAGTLPGDEFDRLLIDGVASLDGTLEALVIDDFAPRPGDQFEFLVASGGIQGAFDQLVLPAGLSLRQSTTTLTLVTVPEPTAYALLCAGLPAVLGGWRRRGHLRTGLE